MPKGQLDTTVAHIREPPSTGEGGSWIELQLLSGERQTTAAKSNFLPQRNRKSGFLTKMAQSLNVGNFLFICSDQEMFGRLVGT